MEIIAYFQTEYKEKFGIPRQSGLVDNRSKIVFVPPYDDPQALRGLEQFSHIWVLWDFSLAREQEAGEQETGGREAGEGGAGAQSASPQVKKRRFWSPTVRPPRLGGNERMGVFATRSPFRPNHIGLSCVRVEEVITDRPQGPAVIVRGADVLDGTPVYDIKPYVPFADCRPEARGGFADSEPRRLKVRFEAAVPQEMSAECRQEIEAVLAQDPRPPYQDDEQRVYGLSYGGWEIKFRGGKDEIAVCGFARQPAKYAEQKGK